MASSTLNVDGIMLFEQPFARVSCVIDVLVVMLTAPQVPYENYRKVFRASQKSIEKELGALQIAAAELSRKARAGGCNPDDAVKAIDAMMKRAENLKRKVRLASRRHYPAFTQLHTVE